MLTHLSVECYVSTRYIRCMQCLLVPKFKWIKINLYKHTSSHNGLTEQDASEYSIIRIFKTRALYLISRQIMIPPLLCIMFLPDCIHIFFYCRTIYDLRCIPEEYMICDEFQDNVWFAMHSRTIYDLRCIPEQYMICDAFQKIYDMRRACTKISFHPVQ